MRRIGIALVTGLALAACAGGQPKASFKLLKGGAAAHERTFTYEHDVQLFEFTNGIKVAVAPDANTNLARVDVRYRVGATEDPEGKEGLAHLVEHLLFLLRADADSPTLGQRIDQASLSYNAYTTWDETHYTATSLADKLPELLALEAERMRGSCQQLDADAFERERAVVQRELAQRDIASVNRLYALLLGADHAYARTAGGDKASVDAITLDDVCGFIDRYYGPANAIIVVSGQVDPQALQKLMGPMFGPITGQPRPVRAMVSPVASTDEPVRAKMAIDEPALILTFPTPAWGDDQRIPLEMAASFIAMELRGADHDWITGVGHAGIGGRRSGAVAFLISVKSEADLARATTAFREAVAEAGKEINTTVFQATRHAYQAEIFHRLDPFESRASQLADYLQYTKHHWLMLAEMNASLVPRERVQNLAATFDPADARVIEVRPSDRKSAKKKQLELPDAPREYDIESWREPVDASEANRPLPPPKNARLWGIREAELDNGMLLAMAPSDKHPIVQVRVIFPAGTAHAGDRPELARRAAALLQLDYKRKLTFQQRLVLLSALGSGGAVDQWVGERSTTFRIRGLSHLEPQLLWELYYLLQAGIYDRDAIVRLNNDDDDDEPRKRSAWQLLREHVFGADHPYARRSSQQPTLAADLRRFRETYYRGPGATILVTGRFDPDIVEAQVRQLFGSWRSGAVPATAPRAPDAAGRAAAIALAHDRVQPRLFVAYPSARGANTDRAAHAVLDDILEIELRRVRERLAASYGAHVDREVNAGPGMLTLYASVAPKAAAAALQAMRQAIAELRAGTDLAQKFVRARRRAMARALAFRADTDHLADSMETAAVVGIKLRDLNGLAGEIAKLTVADIEALIARELAPDREVVLVEARAEQAAEIFKAAGIDNVRTVRD